MGFGGHYWRRANHESHPKEDDSAITRGEPSQQSQINRTSNKTWQWKVANYGKGLAGVSNDMLSLNMGLAALRPSDENFAQIIDF